MSEYKRFTKKDKYGNWYTDTKINDRFMWSKDGKAWERDLTHCAFDGESIDRLAELEDKIENGILIELPCKVGDTVYCIEYFCNSKGCSSAKQIICCGCTEMLKRESKKETYVICEKKFTLKYLSEVNKTIYLTREEAEVKLKKLTEAK